MIIMTMIIMLMEENVNMKLTGKIDKNIKKP
jgi:hypothetical protein